MKIVLSNSSSLFEELDTIKALAVPVNCLGVMGAGLALAVKQRFPEASEVYIQHCKQGLMKPGMVLFTSYNGFYFYFVATKNNWKNKSELSYVKNGITNLVKSLKFDKLKAVAIPALGCGLGGLSWSTVLPLLENELIQSNLETTIYIYPPK
jgi:O-acetyl-ADP-ribose deacetylase (regulator of RNase III)